jgi:diketogulonate reductase-like aldo/keto reductase
MDHHPISTIYGTAWKEDFTAECVYNAVVAGYRAIDTANQRKHYHEQGVGEGLKRAYAALSLNRAQLFIQTKFTYARGQDHRKPYDESASLTEQVRQSMASSLEHLDTDYVDSYLLHGPYQAHGISEHDLETWSAMEELYRQGHTRALGVSNVSVSQLGSLFEQASIKPTFVQNRCYPQIHWDREVRQFCTDHAIAYQGFSLLTAGHPFFGGEMQYPQDRHVPMLRYPNEREDLCSRLHPKLAQIIRATEGSPQQIIFQFAAQLGIIPLVGTRSPENMKANLQKINFTLSDEQMEILQEIAFL